MLKRLPAWKSLILRCIASCVTPDQLCITWEFIELFKNRYSGWIHPAELQKHHQDLEAAYLEKSGKLLTSTVR